MANYCRAWWYSIVLRWMMKSSKKLILIYYSTSYLMLSVYFTQIFNEANQAISEWFFFLFSLCSTRLLTICKNNVTCFKIKIYRSVILIFMLKILPLSVLLYNYLQGFFHSLRLQKISINRYKIGPFQYNIIIYSVIYNLVYLSVFKI